MRVFIACSASDTVSSKYKDMAMRAATIVARCDNKLVFGGVDTGMMGKVYMTFRYEEKKIKAITELSCAEDVEKLECDAYEITRTTFDRTAKLYEACETILILPGGVGTFAEIFSMWDELRTKKDNKKIIIYNYEDFYKPLLNIIKKMYEEHFINEKDIKLLHVVNDEDGLKYYFERLGKKD